MRVGVEYNKGSHCLRVNIFSTYIFLVMSNIRIYFWSFKNQWEGNPLHGMPSKIFLLSLLACVPTVHRCVK